MEGFNIEEQLPMCIVALQFFPSFSNSRLAIYLPLTWSMEIAVTFPSGE